MRARTLFSGGTYLQGKDSRAVQMRQRKDTRDVSSAFERDKNLHPSYGGYIRSTLTVLGVRLVPPTSWKRHGGEEKEVRRAQRTTIGILCKLKWREIDGNEPKISSTRLLGFATTTTSTLSPALTAFGLQPPSILLQQN